MKKEQPRPTTWAAGSYLGCTSCGRLLRIHWPTRSVICSCGAKVTPVPPEPAEQQ